MGLEEIFKNGGELDLLNSLADGVIIADMKTKKFEFVNSAICEMLGYEHHELIEKSVQDIHPVESLDYVFEQFELQARGVKSLAENIPVQTKSGEILFFDVNTVPPSREKYVVGIFRNVTEKKMINDELNRSRHRLHAVLENINEAVVKINSQGKITLFNPAAETIFGYSAAEMIGGPLDKLVPEEYKLQHMENVRSYFANGTPNGAIGDTVLLEGIRKNGERFRMELSLAEMDLRDEKYVMAVIRDVEDRKKLEEEVNQAQKLSTLGQIAGGVAHDFNNLLQGILGYADLLRVSNGIPDSDKEDLEEIIKSANRGADLVKQLLTYSRKMRIKKEKVDINQLILEVSKFLGRTIPKTINLRTSLDEHNRTVEVDYTLLHMGLVNLGINARDAMPEGGSLEFKSELVYLQENNFMGVTVQGGKYMKISVTDSGTGIPKNVKEKIFDPFFTTKEVGKGTGLGLSHVLGLVMMHQGKVEVDSTVGKGTTFNLYLPAANEQFQYQSEILPMVKGSGNILVIDDEPAVGRFVQRALQMAGYTVTVFDTSNKGLSYFIENSHSVDLVLFDMNQPEMNGKELFHRLKEADPQVKGAIISGYFGGRGIEEVLAAGAMGAINKPIQMGDLTAKVKEYISK